MKSCFLFGHQDTTEAVLPELRVLIETHILNFNVTEFLVGHYGGLAPEQVTQRLNELGHTGQSSGIGAFTSGTNATIDQHILIMERYIKI